MTVGYELERMTGLRLFHNHMTIELALRFFDYATPAFSRLVSEFRTRIFEEVATSDLPGMIFTYVWALDDPSDKAEVDRFTATFRSHGAEVHYVELAATQEERHKVNSSGDFFYPEQHLRIDNTNLAPQETATRIIEHFHLPRLG